MLDFGWLLRSAHPEESSVSAANVHLKPGQRLLCPFLLNLEEVVLCCNLLGDFQSKFIVGLVMILAMLIVAVTAKRRTRAIATTVTTTTSAIMAILIVSINIVGSICIGIHIGIDIV